MSLERLVSNYTGCSLIFRHILKVPITKIRPCNIYSFFVVKNENFIRTLFTFVIIFVQSLNSVYTLELFGEAVLTGTHNLCFGSKCKL